MITFVKLKTILQSPIETSPLLKVKLATYKRNIVIGKITGTAEYYIVKSFPDETVKNSTNSVLA